MDRERRMRGQQSLASTSQSQFPQSSRNSATPSTPKHTAPLTDWCHQLYVSHCQAQLGLKYPRQQALDSPLQLDSHISSKQTHNQRRKSGHMFLKLLLREACITLQDIHDDRSPCDNVS